MLSAILMGAWAIVCAYVSVLFQDLLLIPIKYNFTEKKKKCIHPKDFTCLGLLQVFSCKIHEWIIVKNVSIGAVKMA